MSQLYATVGDKIFHIRGKEGMPLGDLGKCIRDALVGIITGAGDVMEAAVDASRRSLTVCLARTPESYQ